MYQLRAYEWQFTVQGYFTHCEGWTGWTCAARTLHCLRKNIDFHDLTFCLPWIVALSHLLGPLPII